MMDAADVRESKTSRAGRSAFFPILAQNENRWAKSSLDLTDSLKEKHGRHGCSQFEFLRHLAR